MDIVTIGEVLIDLTQTGRDEKGIPQFAANPGGAPANLDALGGKYHTPEGTSIWLADVELEPYQALLVHR